MLANLNFHVERLVGQGGQKSKPRDIEGEKYGRKLSPQREPGLQIIILTG